MPVIRVDAQEFHRQLGGEIKFEVLKEKLFQFGIEMDIEEVTEEKIEVKQVNGKEVKTVTKTKLRDDYLIETAANRPDLTCLELIALSAGIFLDFRTMPQFKIQNQSEKRERLVVSKNTKQIRPFCVAAILRGIEFTDTNYKSFIDLQDKLHLTFCRRRKLVAIGTHDLDTVKGPFLYDARAPEDIAFVALKQKESLNANQLLALYEKDNHLKDFVPIIKGAPVYPVIYDANGVVCSMPPIINGEHSKITLNTKNVLIESTATDYNRAVQNLNVIVGAFSYYCKNQFTIEEVEIEYEEDKRIDVTPKWETKVFYTTLENIKRTGTINVDLEQAVKLLNRMQHRATVEGDKIKVEVSPLRSDIIQECDIIEDVCVAYGYNNVVPVLPQSQTVGKQQFLNKMSDLVREELAGCGYKEGLNFALNCEEDLIKKLRKEKDENIVSISNPRTVEFTCGRTTLIPGMLKWMQHNRNNELPFRLFEVGDVILKTDSEIGAKNERRLCALYSNTSAQFELIHGLLDHLMEKLHVKDKLQPVNDKNKKMKNTYEIKQKEDSIFYPQRGAQIFFNDEPIGVMGILHPEINKFYEWPYPVSLLELNIEKIINKFDNC